MTGEDAFKATALKVRRWVPKEVFRLLSDPFRRRVILSLANGEMKTAMELNAASGMKRHTYLKHLSLLCKAGFLLQKQNAKDRRQPLYTLSPGISVCKSNEEFTVDFGCCVLRLSVKKIA